MCDGELQLDAAIIPEIADMLEEDEETIQKICDAASKHAPEYDIDKIIKDLIQ